jgi:hypothetical protein
MSRAFVKDQDEQWLHEVSPTINALVNYLTAENNNIRVYERNNYFDSLTGKQVYEMSNGLSYTRDAENQWVVVGSL